MTRNGWAIFSLIAVLSALAAASKGAPAQDNTDVAAVTAKLALNDWGQYMAKSCQPQTTAGWQGFPTIRCEYKSSTAKQNLPVVMLNAANERVAAWLVSACRDIGSLDPMVCAERIALQIKCQSGNQFPVAGFVQEGGLFLFRDGVTVSIAGVNTGNDIGLSRAPTAVEQQLVLGTGEVAKVYKYARIQGTTREDFAAFIGKPVTDFKDIAWQQTVREEYQAAWSAPRNRLMSAWAVANASRLKPLHTFSKFFSETCPDGTAWHRWT